MTKENIIYLAKKDLPKKWYNIQADLRKPLDPPLHPGTKQPMTPQELEAIFPMNLLEQEVSQERWINIPEDILDVLSMWRPTPLIRATRLEAELKTPAQIWYKYEGGSPPGSHKPNTAVAQAYFNKQAGIKRLSTETGAGQWGSALSFACYHYGIKCQVYMVKVSYNQKPYRKSMMHLWQADVVASPSHKTEAGKKILEKDPDCPGSLGIAISEAVEDTLNHKDTKYALGSVLNHVLLHQTVIGLETKEQFKQAGVKPDVLIGCVGGGSNFAGFAFPFMEEKLTGKNDYRFIAVEPAACPTLTRGEYRYDFGDTIGMTPLMKMYTLGHDFIPAGIHAGGLRYHGMAPLVSALTEQNLIEAQAKMQIPTFEAAVMFARTEGIIPAPETAHAIRSAIDEAIRAKEENKPKVIAFIFSGHGLLDLSAYDSYFSGHLKDFEYVPKK
ncbi:MAG TPA: TrpB-like pyridoxal phosphate-dependent enzyme [Candidatus Sumerlaeota bacterium]|nr:MAG: Tryptophan synthase beta chain [candidate division BRC1 bacterium ADurb.Bin183]HOE62355.1 TrpB-like pyridoxal phosphate-dependent enzyme [Candidatus Sumerlaeota bacterium]HRR29920.1 TrpB-like pyridoxal phosphate-dependent enzyme [Candidatus Sumerlaeia bacterium]HON49270.1 TrpB-like pyridoxal phosphate-dependent enzyme [Candidatus Sumerlaeota bacterium]HOR64123.1 TrpB-like pyridoxal phosphate-dependent enzyme [Candidatus Sumerlaeota bacterium]